MTGHPDTPFGRVKEFSEKYQASVVAAVNGSRLHLADLRMLVALASSAPQEFLTSADNAVKGWVAANARQRQIIDHQQRFIRNAREFVLGDNSVSYDTARKVVAILEGSDIKPNRGGRA